MGIREMSDKRDKEILKRFKKWSWRNWSWDFVAIETEEEERVLDYYASTGWVQYSKDLYDLLVVSKQAKARLSPRGRWLVEAL